MKPDKDHSISSLRERVDQLSVFNEIAKILNSTIDLREVLRTTIEKIAELTEAEAWSIALLDDATGDLVFEAVAGEKEEEVRETRLKKGQGIAGWVAKEGKPLIVPDVTKDDRFFPGVDQRTKFVTESILAVPLISKGRILGVMEAINKSGGGEFTQKDLDTISSLVDHAAIAIENGKLFEAERSRVAELTTVYEIGAAVTSILDLEVLLEKSAHLLRSRFGFYYVGIVFLDKETDDLVFQAFAGREGLELTNGVVKGDQGLMRWAIKERKSVLSPDVSSDLRYLEGIPGVKSEMVVLLKREEEVLGVIDIGSEEVDFFPESSLRMVEQIAAQLSIAMENARLYQKVGDLAISDDLTKLYNSRYCNIFLEKVVTQAKRTGSPVSVIFLDIDFFKRVNDSYGHLVGGTTLKELAERLSHFAREGDVCARYGGDEYVVILPGTELDEASQIAERMRVGIESSPFLTSRGLDYYLTASLGVASYPDCARSRDELLIKADQAMYYVKQSGRNRICAAPKLRAPDSDLPPS